MPSQEDYDSDYDTRPEAGRAKPHLDSDESDNEDSSSGPRGRLRFPNDEGDDDDDPPTTAEEAKREPSAPASASVNPIRQPTAFVAPDPATSTFYKTPIHAAVSAEGTSMFCVEGYVNTPELSAGRGGGLSQGLPANGPYKSLFRARSESRGSNKAAAVAATAPDAGLHVLADAAQSPEALSPPSAASPAPAPAASSSKKRVSRKPSPLAASSPAPSAAPSDPSPAAQPLPEASNNASSSSSHVAVPSPLQRPAQAKPRGGTGKGRSKEKTPSTVPTPPAQADGNNQQYRQQSAPTLPVAESRETESTTQQARPRNVQKNRTGAREMSYTPQHPAPADDGSYDHGGDYYASYYEAEPSDPSLTPVAHQVRDGGQSLSPPPPRTWESPRPSSSAVNSYPVSTHTASNESSPALVADSRARRSQTPSTKPRMLTLLIEDRRNGSDELAEVRVRLKFAEGYFWADAKEVCAALQGGPSRIDGPAKLLTMRGKYRQTFLRVSADGEETCQSANLKVELDKTLSIVVESISDPRGVLTTAALSSNPSPLVTMGPVASALNTAHLLTPMSNALDLESTPTTPPSHEESGQWAVGARKRKRETSLSRIQHSLYDSSDGRNFPITSDALPRAGPTPHERYPRPRKSRRSEPITPFDGGYMSDSPPTAYRGHRIQRKDQIASGSRSHNAGYETDQPLSSVGVRSSGATNAAQEHHHGSDRRIRSTLLPPPTPLESAQRIHDKVISFLQDSFNPSSWNEFARDRAHVGSLSNAMLLRIYWFAQGRLDHCVGSRAPQHLNYKKVEISDVLAALGVTEDWYQECNETLSLAIAYGEGGERCEDPRAVAACRDRAPKSHAGSSGPTDLLALLRQVHEEYCERVGGRAYRTGEIDDDRSRLGV